MQAAGYSRALAGGTAGAAAAAAAAAAAGFGLDEEDFLFYSTDDESAAFLDAPPSSSSAAAAQGGDVPGGAAAVFVSSHFGLPDPATTGVFLATKTITLDGRSWGCGLEEEDIALEQQTAQWLDKDPSDSDDLGNELEPEDLEKFLSSALSPEPDEQEELEKKKKKKPEAEPEIASNNINSEKDQQTRSPVKSQRIKTGNSSHQKSSSDASVLQELETIVSKLDSRSRICLRDAFYRLADNATRRCGAHADAADLQRLSTPSLNRRREASTNSIDRSVASLLFRKKFPPPPLPLPPPSPPRSSPPSRCAPPLSKSLLVTATAAAAAAAATACSSNTIPIPIPRKQQQQQQHQHQTQVCLSNTNKKIPLPPVHKHRCPGSSNVTRTATTLRATPAAIPSAAKNSKSLLLVPAGALKRRIPLGTSSSSLSNVYHNKRGKLHHL